MNISTTYNYESNAGEKWEVGVSIVHNKLTDKLELVTVYSKNDNVRVPRQYVPEDVLKATESMLASYRESVLSAIDVYLVNHGHKVNNALVVEDTPFYEGSYTLAVSPDQFSLYNTAGTEVFIAYKDSHTVTEIVRLLQYAKSAIANYTALVPSRGTVILDTTMIGNTIYSVSLTDRSGQVFVLLDDCVPRENYASHEVVLTCESCEKLIMDLIDLL